MEHNRGSHACAEVCRALCKITELVIKSKFKVFIKQGVKLIGCVICLFKRQAVCDNLKSYVIFLVNHNAHAFILAQQQCSALCFANEFGTYKMSFNK